MYPVRRPARPITKCDRCRGRKSKCDSRQPCGPCVRSKVSCLYTHGRPITKLDMERISTACITPAHQSGQPANAISVREERGALISKIDTLQKLLNDVTAQKPLQAYQIKFPAFASNVYSIGIDLETNNLVTHFSKLWLRKEPDQSFFQATHPALVKLRQEQVPRWQRSIRWKTWSDYQAESKYQQLTRFQANLLPEEKECRDLFWRFITSCDWYFEVLTQTEANLAELEIYHYRSLGLVPSSPEQWTRIALSLAVCRLTLACLDWASTDESEELSIKRCEKILNWCDLAVMALQRAGFDQNPTIEAMRVLIILTSTIFFETDYGLMGSSPQMLKLHEMAIEVSERLNLHRDPPAHFSSKEKDDRRRMWWALVTIDSHFFSTGATSKGVLRLQNSDTKLPVCRKMHAAQSYNYTNENLAPLDLRSACSRFELGKFNNRCCQLLAQRRPLATLSDIWKLDQDLVALEERIPDNQRWSSNLDLNMIFQRPIRPSVPLDDTLRNGQQIFYIGLWHIRSKIHRGLLYAKHTTSDTTFQVNVDAHRKIVRRCSVCLLHLYRHTKLPTAFISAIASAALTLSLELIDEPSQPYNREIRTILLECFSRLQTNSSPIIGRACQVLEYFLEPIQPYVGTSRSYPSGLNDWQGFAHPCVILPENSEDSSENGHLSCADNVPVKTEKGSLGVGSPGSLVDRIERKRESTSSSPYFDSTNDQPTIGLTNPFSQVTTDGLLKITEEDGKFFQLYQENFQEQPIEKSNEFKFYNNDEYYFNGIKKEKPTSFATPSFQLIGSSENYLQPAIVKSPVGNPTPTESISLPTTFSNPSVYSNNDDKRLIYPTTIRPTDMIQPHASCSNQVQSGEELYYYYRGPEQALVGRTNIEQEPTKDNTGIYDLGFADDLRPIESGSILNANYSLDQSSNIYQSSQYSSSAI